MVFLEDFCPPSLGPGHQLWDAPGTALGPCRPWTRSCEKEPMGWSQSWYPLHILIVVYSGYIYIYITLHYITLHYITLHYITLHYITLHYITYITLQYITLHTLHTCNICPQQHMHTTLTKTHRWHTSDSQWIIFKSANYNLMLEESNLTLHILKNSDLKIMI